MNKLTTVEYFLTVFTMLVAGAVGGWVLHDRIRPTKDFPIILIPQQGVMDLPPARVEL